MSTVGHLLWFRIKDGKFRSGRTDIAIGTRFIAHMEELRAGWIKNTAGRFVAAGRLADGFLPPKRSSLGDNDSALWDCETDPWQRCDQLVLRNFSTGGLYTFSATSEDELAAIRELCQHYGRHLRTAKHEVPIIRLGVKPVGTLYSPKFEVVDWMFSPSGGVPTNIPIKVA